MNKVVSLEVLNDLKNYLQNTLNNEINTYNIQNSTNLKNVNNITYNNVTFNFPEIYFQITRTNFEYEDITTNKNMKITNDLVLFYTDKSVLKDFQTDIERMIYILYKILNNFQTENVAYALVESVERDELQSKDLQIVKVIQFNFKTISLI